MSKVVKMAIGFTSIAYGALFCLTSSDSLCVSDILKSERSFDQGALERLTSAEKMQLCEATGGLWEVVASSSPLFQLWQTLVRVPN